MPVSRAKIKLPVNLPSSGLVVDRPAEFVDPRSVVNTQNMEYNRGIIRKRLGTSLMGSSMGERVMAMFELNLGGTTRLCRVGLTKFQAYNKATSVWSDYAYTPLTGTAEDPVSYAFPTLNGSRIAVYSNNVDAIRKVLISNDDAALGGSPPIAKFMQAVGPYLLLANVTDSGNLYPSRVQWCDTGNPELWTPASDNNAGSQDLLDDPEDITGLGMFGNLVTVHKPYSIYTGYLTTTGAVFQFVRQVTGVGAVSGATIQTLPTGEQIFLGSDGIHLFNGITAPLIRSPIWDEIREEMNPEYSYKAQSVFVKELDEYWVCVPLGSDTEP
ncbi:MAG: hypothetical protein KGL39_53235, partial [Patescibacteria group bacterium]|nr:hypothetical protein [Patescibacteria group bacterium]